MDSPGRVVVGGVQRIGGTSPTLLSSCGWRLGRAGSGGIRWRRVRLAWLAVHHAEGRGTWSMEFAFGGWLSSRPSPLRGQAKRGRVGHELGRNVVGRRIGFPWARGGGWRPAGGRDKSHLTFVVPLATWVCWVGRDSLVVSSAGVGWDAQVEWHWSCGWSGGLVWGVFRANFRSVGREMPARLKRRLSCSRDSGTALGSLR